MWLKVLRGLRLWNLFLSFAIIATRSAFIGILHPQTQLFPYDGISPYDRDLQDIWYTIVLATLFFLVYLYSLKGKPLFNKYLRALLMLSLVGILLYFNIHGVVARIQGQSRENQAYKDIYGQTPSLSPIDCSVTRDFTFHLRPANAPANTTYPSDILIYDKTSPSILCLLQWISVFLAIIMAPFIVVEVLLALRSGPLNVSSTQKRYGRNGYQGEANVVIVSPDKPYQLQQQGVTPQDNSQQHQQHFSMINATPDPNYGYPQHHHSISGPGHKEEYLGHLLEPQGSQQHQQEHRVVAPTM
ncbi:hypothetical protein BGZ83_000634 [Gryganskiella cystojenkinii]|nr:hypothetical protein BGZ83_000634 [Gryganskiella cystojenkinii]